MRCLNCGNEFEGRAGAKCCSARCRVAYSRKRNSASVTDKPISVTSVTDKPISVTVKDGQLVTDKLAVGMGGVAGELSKARQTGQKGFNN